MVTWSRLQSPKLSGLVFIPDKFLPENWQADASFHIMASMDVALDVWGFQLPPGLTRSSTASNGDETWILYGLKVPVVLRPERKSGKRCYYLINAACFIIDTKGHRVDKMPSVFSTVKRQRISII